MEVRRERWESQGVSRPVGPLPHHETISHRGGNRNPTAQALIKLAVAQTPRQRHGHGWTTGAGVAAEGQVREVAE